MQRRPHVNCIAGESMHGYSACGGASARLAARTTSRSPGRQSQPWPARSAASCSSHPGGSCCCKGGRCTLTGSSLQRAPLLSHNARWPADGVAVGWQGPAGASRAGSRRSGRRRCQRPCTPSAATLHLFKLQASFAPRCSEAVAASACRCRLCLLHQSQLRSVGTGEPQRRSAQQWQRPEIESAPGGGARREVQG